MFPDDICAYDKCRYHVDLAALKTQHRERIEARESKAARLERLQAMARVRREELREYGRTFPEHDRPVDETNGLGFDVKDRELMTETVPCINCLGAVRYCSVECLIRHRPQHQKRCIKTFRQVQDRIFQQRVAQVQSEQRGYPGLMQHVLTNTERAVLVSHVFFTRLPFDTRTNVPADYPIKRVPYTELAKVVRDNQCLRDTYKALLTEMKQARENMIDQVYFVAYTPDLMITWLNIIPFEDAAKLREANVSVKGYTTLCPCMLHQGRK